MAISIDQRYDDLLSLSTTSPETIINWSHITTVDPRAAIVAILQQEYDKSTFNTWASAHGVPQLP